MYSSTFLQSIRQVSHLQQHYSNFQLSQDTRASIIALGIRKQSKEQPYRRSRAGNRLFHRIHSSISPSRNLATGKKLLISTIDHTNLQPIQVNKFTSKWINISHINARSINNNVLDFQQYVTSNLIDICAISEIWIRSDVDTNTIKEIAPQEDKILSQPCKSGKQGGGLALVYKENSSVKKTSDDKINFGTMEISTFEIKFAGTAINLYLIYRLPSTSVLQFCSDMTDIMERRIMDDLGKLLLIGDFNIHIDEATEPDTITFLDFLDSFNLTNHVQWLMHRLGHTLDLLISDQDDTSIKSVTKEYVLSDHTFIVSTIEVQHDKPTTRLIKCRNFKDVNKDLFFDGHSWEPIIITSTKWTNYVIRYGGYIQ